MSNEKLLADLKSQGIILPPDSLELAQKVNALGGASIPDSTPTTALYYWNSRTLSVPTDWFNLMSSLKPLERTLVHTTIGSAFRAFSLRRDPLLPQGVVGELRDLSVNQLLQVSQLGGRRIGFIKIAFDSTELEEDEYTLSEMPSKRVLEDFLRVVMGKSPLSDRTPAFNFVTRRMER